MTPRAMWTLAGGAAIAAAILLLWVFVRGPGAAPRQDGRGAGPGGAASAPAAKREKETKAMAAMAGAYYFDGWAGRHRRADDPAEPWARNAPVQLTRRMVEEFPGREPVWGWRDDSLPIMERQIDLAADHGLAFFAFCWYWHDNGQAANPQAIQDDPKHTGLRLFLQARNNGRMKFCLLVANHQGFEIKGTDAWKQAADLWMPYLRHPRHVTVGGKPLVIVFNPKGGDAGGLAYVQEAARKAALPGVALASCGEAPADMGYTHRTHYNLIPGYWGGSAPHPYSELVAEHENAWKGRPDQPYMPIVIAGWDKRPWENPATTRPAPAWYFPDRTPEQFGAHVRKAVAWMDAHPDQTTAERILMIYAWNEYGEGGYLAPTQGDPSAVYLEALRSALQAAPPGTKG